MITLQPNRSYRLVWVTLLNLSLIAVRAEGGDLRELLELRVIDPELPLREVQEFTEGRIPPIPEFQTAEEWTEYASRLRDRTLKEVVFRGEAAKWRSYRSTPVWLETIERPGYVIRKLRFEAVPGMWVPALLYEPRQLEGRVPVVLNVNGHDRGDGKAADYKQIRCINQVRRGMLALNIEWLGMGQLNTPGFGHYKMNQLDLCGTSGLAPFYLSMSRGLDILLDHPHADPQRVAVAGLSGGGWQTIFISALDTRVTLANPVAGYSSFRTRARYFSDLGDSEQTPSDLATVVDYTHLTAMRAPRPTLLTNNAQDQCCFKAEHALPPLVEAAAGVYELFGRPDALRIHVNHDPGTHNFERDNRQQLYGMLKDFFAPDEAGFSTVEIDCADQLLSREELAVELPEENQDFHSLALSLGEQLKARQEQAVSAGAMRDRLRRVVSAHDWPVRGIVENTHMDSENNVVAVTWWLRVDGQWTVPGVELRSVHRDPAGTVILVADSGRASLLDAARKHLDQNERVLVVDPFYFGESKITQRDFLFGLLVAAVGERPIGIQSSQLAGIARWARHTWQSPVKLESHGPRISLAAEIAAALETDAIAHVTVHQAMSTLHEVILEDRAVNETPELFCFGLMKECDIPQIESLIGTQRLTRVESP